MIFFLKVLTTGIAVLMIVLSLGCLSVDHIEYIYVVDTLHEICSKRIITDQKTLASKWVEDLDLAQCDGNISITAKDWQTLRGKR